MHYSQTSRLALAPALVLALLAALTVAGCDSNNEEEEEVFAQLQGSWGVVSFRYNGDSYLGDLEGLYGNGTRFTFFESEGNDLRYRIRGFTETEEGDLTITGRLDIDVEGEELSFGGQGVQEIEVNYDLVADDRLVLTTKDERDTETLFETLLQGEISIDPDSESENLRIVLEKT